MRLHSFFAFAAVAMFLTSSVFAEELTYNVDVVKVDGSVVSGTIVVETETVSVPLEGEDPDFVGFYEDSIVSLALTCTSPDGSVRVFALNPDPLAQDQDALTPVANTDGELISSTFIVADLNENNDKTDPELFGLDSDFDGNLFFISAVVIDAEDVTEILQIVIACDDSETLQGALPTTTPAGDCTGIADTGNFNDTTFFPAEFIVGDIDDDAGLGSVDEQIQTLIDKVIVLLQAGDISYRDACRLGCPLLAAQYYYNNGFPTKWVVAALYTSGFQARRLGQLGRLDDAMVADFEASIYSIFEAILDAA